MKATTKITAKAAVKPASKLTNKKPARPERCLDFKTVWNYKASPESAESAKLEKRYELFIDGKFVPPSDGAYFANFNPATEAKLCEVAEGSPADVDRAVKSARAAFEGVWAKLPAHERGKCLFRLARLIQERTSELAVTETLDTGKPIRESRAFELPLAANQFFYYAGWADKLGFAFPGRRPRPIGVVAGVISWNFPLLMAARKLAPALAAGNTVVLKPSKTAPLAALKLARLAEEAGFPPGVVNVVTGGKATGEALVAHEGVALVSFAGATETGKAIGKALAGTARRCALELGGKNAYLIFEDSAIDQAVDGIVDGVFLNQGPVLSASSRLYVQESIAKVVVRKLRDRLETLNVGDPLDKNTDVGALPTRELLQRVQAHVKAGLAEGVTSYQADQQVPKKGFFHAPVLFTDVAQSHRLTQEEVFGPVLAIQTFRTAEEAIEKANNTPSGMASGVWTDKGSRIFSIARQLKTGVVWANAYNKYDPTSPAGGCKESGLGRDGGLHGLASYVELN
ncbi:MAG: aldehyde dehydrogenase family protein [Oligoflexia bacterium]|nr:aldehyde dehydrogenase family protein [Oligoflexia bacterium]